nr:glycosyltransferase [Citrifermentans bremense]
MDGPRQVKVMRIVTSSECVPWHLGNTLKRIFKDFEVSVVGHNVSDHSALFPNVRWFDLHISRKVSFLSDLYALINLIRIITLVKPDIVHSIMPKAGLLTAIAGFICRVPIRIHTFTGQVWATQTGFLRQFLWSLDKLIATLNTVCLSDSPSQSTFLFQHNITYAGVPLPVLLKGSLSGYDNDKINLKVIGSQAELLRDSLGVDRSDFVFAYIARKTRDKGAIDMILAFSMVTNLYPKAKLVYVGPDETGGEIDEMRKTNPRILNNVLSVGKVNNHELYLAISHVLCLPSYREGFGTIVIDAAALGIPTIGSNIVGLVDSIEDGQTGILFPAGNLDQLKDAMLFMLQNVEKCKQMGQLAKQRVEAHFTADILYAALKRLYHQHMCKNDLK